MQYTPEEDLKEICRLYRKGKTLEEIEEIMNISAFIIRKELKKHDFSDRVKIKKKPMYSYAEVQEPIEEGNYILAKDKRKIREVIINGKRYLDICDYAAGI